MKFKKLLSAVIIIVAVLAIAVYSLVCGIAQKPNITEAEFPFSITYELDGETVTVNDVYKARYDGNGGYADTKSRIYVGEIGDMGEGNTHYVLKKDSNGRIELTTNFYADYLMGDSEYDYFDDEVFEPRIYYYDAEEQEYGDEETLSAHGVKLISFEYPAPIENSFAFSHISYMSSSVVLPTVLIALLALIAVIVFVKKDAKSKYSSLDKISVALNYIICLAFVPFVTLAATLIDINGGSPELYHQMFYFFPSFSVLCIATSVALRRNGNGKQSLVAQLIAPSAFGIFMTVCGILGLG